MDPNQSTPNNESNETPAAPVTPFQQEVAPQPVMPLQPVVPVQAPVQPVAVPVSSQTPSLFGFLSLGLGVAAVIAQPLIVGLSTTSGSIWLLLIPLLLGVGGTVLGVMTFQKSDTVKAIVLLGVVISSIAAVMSFSQLTQSLIVQQRTAAQIEKYKAELKIPTTNGTTTTPSGSSSLTAPSSQGGTSTDNSDTMKEIQAARDRVNKQMEEARLRAESLSR